MTPEERDDIVQDLLRRSGNQRPPVRLETIVPLVNAELLETRDMPAGLPGFTVRGRLRWYILVNRRTGTRTHRQFTIAHEIGHVIEDEVECALFSPHERYVEGPERQANLFAGALLMPTDFVLKDVETILALADATWEPWAQQAFVVEELARRYNVSGVAMRIRLDGLVGSFPSVSLPFYDD